MSLPIERAVLEIQKRRSVRTPILASLLDMDDEQVDRMLAPLRARGELVCCDVQVGGAQVVEYRCSAAQGLNSTNPHAHLFQPKTAPAQASVPGLSRLPAQRPEAAPAPVVVPKENPMAEKKPLAERIVETLRKHGDLDLDAIAKHAGTTKTTLSTMMGSLCKSHGVRRVKRGVYAIGGEPSKNEGRKPGKVNDSPLDKVLADLRGRKESLLAEATKIDVAIAAVEAIAA